MRALLRKFIARFFHFMVSLIDPLNRLFLLFRTKFILLDIKPPTCLRRLRTKENIEAVWATVNDDHQLLFRRRSQQLDLY